MSLSLCRIVLVEPRIAANLGATARVMHNFGLRDLVLVRPQADPGDREARKLSTQGEPILDRVRIVRELGDAVADCVYVAGTSARSGGPVRRQSVAAPDEIMPRLWQALAAGPAALVFGREANGLTDAEVTRCHHLIHLPTAEDYSSLNLAQAVAICLYELFRAAQAPRGVEPVTEALATFADQERMFDHLRTALTEIHFLYGPKAESLMHAVRHLLSRARLSTMEVELLHGLARQICWYAAEHPKAHSAAEMAER
jgi:tRNA/rRNA methyltransferase